MKQFLIFDRETGRALQTSISTDADSAVAGFDAGIGAVEVSGDISDAGYYVNTSNQQPVSIPPKPYPWYEFDWATHSWADKRSLAKSQSDKLAEMKAGRDAKLYGGFTVGSNTFDSTPQAQAAIQLNYLQAVNAKADAVAFTVTWTMADNSDVVLNRGQVIAMGDGLQKLMDNSQTKYRAKKAAVLAAGTVAEVNAITW